MKITGELLKAERIKRDLTVQDIAQALKLSARTITLIEAGDLEQLPSKTFVRGFVKGYADYLKIDSDIVMKQFQEEMGTTHPVPKTPPPGMKPESKKTLTPSASDSHLSKRNIIYFSVVTVLVLLVILTNKIISHYQNEVIAESISQNQAPADSSAEAVSAASVAANPEDQMMTVAASQPIQSAAQSTSQPQATLTENQKPIEALPAAAAVAKPSEPPAVKSKAQPVEVLIEAKKDGQIEYAKGNTSDFKKISLKANTYQILKSASGLHLRASDGSLFNITVNGINKGSMSSQSKSVEMTF